MSKLKIRNGTPVGNKHLCMRCSWGQCIIGYRESDRLVICNKTNPDMVLPFAVLECTSFEDKHRPDWNQMQKLAIRVGSVRVSKRTAGFNTALESRPILRPKVDESEDGEEDEAAFAG
ncbi:MAG: hypothetical protein WBA18_11710 [Terracidiphilus sp.]